MIQNFIYINCYHTCEHAANNASVIIHKLPQWYRRRDNIMAVIFRYIEKGIWVQNSHKNQESNQMRIVACYLKVRIAISALKQIKLRGSVQGLHLPTALAPSQYYISTEAS